MVNDTYKISDNSSENLKKLGFRRTDDGIYEKTFAGYKWQGYVTITCKFIAFDDCKDIMIDVLQEDGNFYSPYYSGDKNNNVLVIVKQNIKKELERCKITKEGK